MKICGYPQLQSIVIKMELDVSLSSLIRIWISFKKQLKMIRCHFI